MAGPHYNNYYNARMALPSLPPGVFPGGPGGPPSEGGLGGRVLSQAELNARAGQAHYVPGAGPVGAGFPPQGPPQPYQTGAFPPMGPPAGPEYNMLPPPPTNQPYQNQQPQAQYNQQGFSSPGGPAGGALPPPDGFPPMMGGAPMPCMQPQQQDPLGFSANRQFSYMRPNPAQPMPFVPDDDDISAPHMASISNPRLPNNVLVQQQPRQPQRPSNPNSNPKVANPASAAPAAAKGSDPKMPRKRKHKSGAVDSNEKKRTKVARKKIEFQRQQTRRFMEAPDPDKVLKESFAALDKDKNGVLTAEETKVGMANLGLSIPTDIIKRMIRRMSSKTDPYTDEPALDFAGFKQFVQDLIALRENFTRFEYKVGYMHRVALNEFLRNMQWDLPDSMISQLVAMINPSKYAGDELLYFEDVASMVIYLQDLTSSFRANSKNNPNVLSRAELQALIRTLGIYVSVIEVDIHLKRIGVSLQQSAAVINFETVIALLQSIRLNREAVRKEAMATRRETKRKLMAPQQPVPAPAARSPGPRPQPSRRMLNVPQPQLNRRTTFVKIEEATSRNKDAERIIASLKARPGQKWEDPDFPANAQSLFPFDLKRAETIKSWRRPTEIVPKPQLFLDGMDQGDVVQGTLGDCWFIGALSVLATSPDNILQRLFVSQYPQYGFFQVTVYKDGEWQVVTIDDRLPCNANGKPSFASCRDENEFWVPILEKAYAKLHGSYQAIESGNMSDAFVDLSGESSETMNIVSTDEQWKKLQEFFKEGYLMGCSCNIPTVDEPSPLGILRNHAYGILEVREFNGNRLIRIRNPWGSHEWTGAWSDEAKEWTPAIIKALGVTFGDDGSFWMSFDDFCEQYTTLSILRTLSDDIGTKWFKQPFAGAWAATTAGGSNEPSWNTNPQYKLVNQGNKPSRVFLSLRQPDLRMNWRPGTQYPAIGFLVMKDDRNDDYCKLYQPEEGVLTERLWKHGRECATEFTALPGVKYIIVPCTWEAGIISKFTLTVYSIEKCLVTPARQPPVVAVQGAWSRARRTAGGCRNNESWTQNPQYILRVSRPCRPVILLEQPDSATAIGAYVMASSELGSRKKTFDWNADISGSVTFMYSANVAYEYDLKPGLQYNILPCTFEPGVEREFVLKIACVEGIQLIEAEN